MPLYGCSACGSLWPTMPHRDSQGQHIARLGDACPGPLEALSPTSALWKAEATREAAIQRAEHLASRLTVSEGTIRQLSRGSKRNLERFIASHRELVTARSLLKAGQSRPARVAALLIRIRRLLSEEVDACWSCGLKGICRPNCRRQTALGAISDLMEPHGAELDFEMQVQLDTKLARKRRIRST